MKRKFLEDLGLEEEAINKIMAENGKDLNELKAKVDELTEQIAVKETTISEKNNKIAELEKVDVEAIKTAEYERGKTDGSKEIEDFKKSNALNKALKEGFKVKDPELIKPKLKLDQIEYEPDGDGFKVSKGLEEQVNPLKETYGYVFDSDKPLPTFTGNINPPANGTQITKEVFNKMGYQARLKLYNENKSLYDQLTEKNN